MGLFGLFGGSNNNTKKSSVLDVAWSKGKTGKFRRLSFLDVSQENVAGVSAVYVIWHGGMKPGWVYVGMTDDLATDIEDALQSHDIMEYDKRGGLFITWQTFPKTQMTGVFNFLSDVLQPEVRNPEAEMHASTDHVKVLPPGYTQESFAKMFGKG